MGFETWKIYCLLYFYLEKWQHNSPNNCINAVTFSFGTYMFLHKLKKKKISICKMTTKQVILEHLVNLIVH